MHANADESDNTDADGSDSADATSTVEYVPYTPPTPEELEMSRQWLAEYEERQREIDYHDKQRYVKLARLIRNNYRELLNLPLAGGVHVVDPLDVDNIDDVRRMLNVCFVVPLDGHPAAQARSCMMRVMWSLSSFHGNDNPSVGVDSGATGHRGVGPVSYSRSSIMDATPYMLCVMYTDEYTRMHHESANNAALSMYDLVMELLMFLLNPYNWSTVNEVAAAEYMNRLTADRERCLASLPSVDDPTLSATMCIVSKTPVEGPENSLCLTLKSVPYGYDSTSPDFFSDVSEAGIVLADTHGTMIRGTYLRGGDEEAVKCDEWGNDIGPVALPLRLNDNTGTVAFSAFWDGHAYHRPRITRAWPLLSRLYHNLIKQTLGGPVHASERLITAQSIVVHQARALMAEFPEFCTDVTNALERFEDAAYRARLSDLGQWLLAVVLHGPQALTRFLKPLLYEFVFRSNSHTRFRAKKGARKHDVVTPATAFHRFFASNDVGTRFMLWAIEMTSRLSAYTLVELDARRGVMTSDDLAAAQQCLAALKRATATVLGDDLCRRFGCTRAEFGNVVLQARQTRLLMRTQHDPVAERDTAMLGKREASIRFVEAKTAKKAAK